jgi:hypothetical protein
MGHECFYEYREVSDFIALVDLDDILITNKFQTTHEAFASALQQYPNTAYFLVNKFESSFNEQS